MVSVSFFFLQRGWGLIDLLHTFTMGVYHDSQIRYMYRVSYKGVFIYTDLSTAVVHILDQWILFQFTKDAFFAKIDMSNRCVP